MKRLAIPVLMLSLLCSPVQGEVQDSDLVSQVRAAVERFGVAFREADVEALRAMLTDDYVHINGGSGNRIDRAQWLHWVQSQRALMDEGKLRIDTYEITDLDVSVHANAAVVTGTVHSRGIRNGEPFDSAVRFTNLWIGKDGIWRRAAFHDSPLAN